MINFMVFLFIPLCVICSKQLEITKNGLPVSQFSAPQKLSANNHQNLIGKSNAKLNHRYMDENINRLKRDAPSLMLEPPIKWNYLRRFICGSGNPNCINDERINSIMNPEILRKISKIADLSLDDWSTKKFLMSPEFSSDVNIWNSVNLSGRREGPLYAEEPDFILVKEDQIAPQIFGPDYADDPFIPQRGRKNYDYNELPFNNYKREFVVGQNDKRRRSKIRSTAFNNDKTNQQKKEIRNSLTMTSHFNERKKTELSSPGWCCGTDKIKSKNIPDNYLYYLADGKNNKIRDINPLPAISFRRHSSLDE